MNVEACYYLGYTSKVHGKQGELIVKLDVDTPEEYQNLESVLVRIQKQDNALVPFFLSHAFIQNNGTLRIKIDNINTVEEAKSLVGKSLFLPLETLPKLTGNQFYFHEVKGFTIVDTNHGTIGTIKEILEYPTQSIFEVINDKQQEILIPINDHIIQHVNRETQQITVTTPEGLIDLYLE